MCEYLRIFLFTHSLFDFFNSVQKSHNKFRNYVQAEITAWTDNSISWMSPTPTPTTTSSHLLWHWSWRAHSVNTVRIKSGEVEHLAIVEVRVEVVHGHLRTLFWSLQNRLGGGCFNNRYILRSKHKNSGESSGTMQLQCHLLLMRDGE